MQNAVRVLIVDDEPDMRLLTRLTLDLTDNDISVVGEVASGQEALACVDDCDPTVVVLDLRMPGLDGFGTAAAMLERRPHQRVILLSAQLTPQIEERAADVGIEACLDKWDLGRLKELAHGAVASDST
jgi:CheY-like chemotaxis protein